MFIRDKNELATKVVECYEHNNKIYIVLEDTIFYPESGGQLCDKGTINDVKVIDVFKHDNNIVHEVGTHLSGEVKCVLDTFTRYKNSKLHTAQHLLSYVVESSGISTTSFYMRDNYFVIDIEKKLTREELDCFENEINEHIFEGRNIKCRSFNIDIDADIDVSGYQFKKEDIKIVEIEGLVKDICGGTHISNINEIKYLKIAKMKTSPDKTKITVYIGDEAIKYNQTCFNSFQEILRIVNTDETRVVEELERRLKDYKKNQKELKKIRKQSNSEVS